MKVQFLEEVLKEKILLGVEPYKKELTHRNTPFPSIREKAFAVIGMRRAGKTTFLHQSRNNLMNKGRAPEQLLYFNFEDERLPDLELSQCSLIPEIHERLFPCRGKKTFFFDEIQRIDGWERFIRRLLDDVEYEIFLSGSSAKLLSREIATSMRGRAWEIPIYPFSFSEFLRHHKKEIPSKISHLTSKKKLTLDHQFARFLKLGGLPEVQFLSTPDRLQLLQEYIDVLLLRDVIERHQVSNVIALRWMTRRLLSNPAGLFSMTKFNTDLKSQGIAVSRETLYELLEHLKDTFLLNTISIATDSEKRRQVRPRKIYPVDTGFIPLFDRSGKPNTGHALETAIFVELQRRRAEVAYVHNDDETEVDFLVRYPNGKENLIQVCTSLHDSITLHREIHALEEAHKTYPRAQRLILTLESHLALPEIPRGIKLLPAWEWMLS